MCAARLRSKEREMLTTTTTTTTSFTTPQPSSFIYIDYVLDTQTDTLHTISMRFGVSIGDLKRLNSLQNDRDIFALKFVKIPIKPNSYQSELYASQLKYSDTILTRLSNGDFEPLVFEPTSTTVVVDSDDEPRLPANSQPLIDLGHNDSSSEETSRLLTSSNNPVSPSDQAREARKFLRKFDNQVDALISQNQEIITEVQSKHEPVAISNISYMVESRSRQSLSPSSSTSIFGMNVREIFVIGLIIVVVFPLIFLLYRYVYLSEHDQKLQHVHHHR